MRRGFFTFSSLFFLIASFISKPAQSTNTTEFPEESARLHLRDIRDKGKERDEGGPASLQNGLISSHTPASHSSQNHEEIIQAYVVNLLKFPKNSRTNIIKSN
ncbi:MAG: hypothetical protein IBJ00_01430, partial [Alphaproteobacteria bacterium]|nr:hypothetical protein [Alphaproteobacteria bacterium]